jgi:hypothetical protein
MRRLAAIALVVAACGPRSDAAQNAATDSSAMAAAAAPNVVHIVATDFAFEMPDTLPAGLTTFHLMNKGPDWHHATLVRLEDGHTMADVQAEYAKGEVPAWAHVMGGPNAPFAGGTSETTMNLEPGNYAVLCFVPSADGVPHIAKGMMRALTVVPSDAPASPLPEADLAVTMTDYDWTMSAPISAGEQSIRIENNAAQPHELWFAKLTPGTTAEQLMAWFEKPEGPPPFTESGGIGALEAGQVQLMKHDFTPGDYALICWIDDATDGRPHFMHGMLKQITVAES